MFNYLCIEPNSLKKVCVCYQRNRCLDKKRLVDSSGKQVYTPSIRVQTPHRSTHNGGDKCTSEVHRNPSATIDLLKEIFRFE